MPIPKRRKPLRHGDTEDKLANNSPKERLQNQEDTSKQTLLDLRGSIPVSGPQDFDAIRQHVRKAIRSHINSEGSEDKK